MRYFVQMTYNAKHKSNFQKQSKTLGKVKHL